MKKKILISAGIAAAIAGAFFAVRHFLKKENVNKFLEKYLQKAPGPVATKAAQSIHVALTQLLPAAVKSNLYDYSESALKSRIRGWERYIVNLPESEAEGWAKNAKKWVDYSDTWAEAKMRAIAWQIFTQIKDQEDDTLKPGRAQAIFNANFKK